MRQICINRLRESKISMKHVNNYCLIQEYDQEYLSEHLHPIKYIRHIRLNKVKIPLQNHKIKPCSASLLIFEKGSAAILF